MNTPRQSPSLVGGTSSEKTSERLDANLRAGPLATDLFPFPQISRRHVPRDVWVHVAISDPMLEWDMTTERFIFQFGPGGTYYLNPDNTLTPNVIVYAFQQV